MTQLPAGWRVVQLGDVAETALGKMLDKSKDTGGARTPYLRNVNVQWGLVDTSDVLTVELSEAERARFALRDGDLLVCEGGEVGRAAIWSGTGYMAYQKALHRIRPGANLDVRFLRYLLEHLHLTGHLASVATGSTIKHLPQERLRELPVPLPPVEEQRRIIDILEDHLSRLDAAVGGVLGVPNRLEAMRLSALTRQRQRLIDGGAPSRRLAEVADTTLGKMLDAKRSHGVATPYLRNINVRWGAVEVGDVQTVSLSEDERAKFALEPGDLLVCEGGEPGRCAIWPGSEDLMTFQKALHRVRVRDGDTTDIRYVALMLEEFIKSGRADAMYTGTTIRHLPQEKLRLVAIPLPPLAAQMDVVDSMETLTDSVEAASRQFETADRRAGTLRRSLLAAAFSGCLTESHSPRTSEVYAGV